MVIIMNSGELFGAFIMTIVALVMIGIGIYQFTCKDTVGFYSGETPPKKEELKDWVAWNRKHGLMWIIYGVLIAIGSYVPFVIIKDTSQIAASLSIFLGVLMPLPIMIWYDHRLRKKYIIK